MDLTGKVAIVTGGGRGIGRAEACALAGAGAQVVVNSTSGSRSDSDLSTAQETVGLIEAAGGQAVAHQGDVSSWDVARQLIDCAVDTFGRLDVLVNNAGKLIDTSITEMSEDEWDDIIRVNMKGHVAPTQFAVRYWRSLGVRDSTVGRIINTSSQAAVFGRAGRSVYAASKGGVIGLTFSLAQELIDDKVTCNAIFPRARTQMSFAHPETVSDVPPDHFDPWDPAHIGTVLAWLCSDQTADVNGRLFLVYGGSVWLLDRHRPVAGISEPRPLTATDLAPLADLVADAPVRLRPPWTGEELLDGRFDD